MSKHKHCKHYYKLLSIIKEKDEEIAELKKRLRYYENYNSPPSANSLLWKKQKKERRADGNNKDERKLGRKNGHQGISHSFKASESVEHGMRRCNRCGSPSISLKHQEYRIIVDVPAPEPYTVKEHIINIYHCKRCNSEVRPEVDIPKHGMLGKNLLAMIATLWSARLPIGKIVSMLKAVYGLKISAGTINNALVNVAESLQRFANKVRGNIIRSASAGFDETSISINGKKGWIWCAASNLCLSPLDSMFHQALHQELERRLL